MRDYVEQVKELRKGAEWAKKLCAHETAKRQSDAADAIEELLAAVPKWVSVEERLPEINDDVLVCNMDYGKTELGFATDAVWDGDNFLSAWDCASAIHCVTHWMPLPKAPEEVE